MFNRGGGGGGDGDGILDPPVDITKTDVDITTFSLFCAVLEFEW